MIGSLGPPEVFTTVLAVVMAAGLARLLLRERRATRAWSAVRNDPVIRQFDGVRVQVNPGKPGRQVTLKSGGLGTRVLVDTRSLQIGPYSLEASETTMEHGRARFGWHELDCVILSGAYGGQPVRLALALDVGLGALWAALQAAGVQEASPPPPA